MGITIQQYRSRIGRFMPKHVSNRSERKNIYEVEVSQTILFLRILYLFSALVIPMIFALQQHNLVNQQQSYSQPIYPTDSQQLFIHHILPFSSRGCVPSLPPNHSRWCRTSSPSCSAWSPPWVAGDASSLSSFYFRRITNFEARYTNGNGRNKGIKIAHWNKGGAFLVNKMANIKNIVQQHHPHILGLSEANLQDVHDHNLLVIPDYTLHVCPTISNPSLRTSRVVVYTHKDVVQDSTRPHE